MKKGKEKGSAEDGATQKDGKLKGELGVSNKHQRVNLCYCASGPDGILKRHKVYTGSDRMSLRPVRGCCSCY